MEKGEIQWIKENWKEILGILYNNTDEKTLFEVLLMDYEPCKGFLEVLQKVILANKNWFTSNITFETKVTLLKEIVGDSFKICKYCGSIETSYQKIEQEQRIIIICKLCNSKIYDIKIQNPKF